MNIHSVNLRVGHAISIEALINGIPFIAHYSDEAFASEMPFEQDVLPGDNLLSLRIGLAGYPNLNTVARTGPPREGMYLHATLNVETPNQVGKNIFTRSEEVAQVDWDPAAQQLKEITLPHVITLPFQAPVGRGPVWLEAAPVEESSIAARALTLVQSLVGMLARRDVSAFIDTRKLKYQDLARAYALAGNAEAQRTANQGEIESILSRPNIQVQDPATLKPRFPVYAGRVIDCLGADGRPLLRVSSAGNHTVYLGMKLALVHGVLAVIR